MPLLALCVALVVGLGGLGIVLASGGGSKARMAAAAAMAVAGIAFAAKQPRPAPPVKGAPMVAPTEGYVGSGACAGCHPGEHASWSMTYHRTMTQAASRATVLAPLGATIEAEAIRYTLVLGDGDSVWVHTDRGGSERVLITTGSHHMQGYWVGSAAGILRMLPFVFARDEGKVLARRDAFVEPPDTPQRDVRWNSNCIACHATAGEPRARGQGAGYDTRVAELGIACEACHGPGAAHVSRHHDPVERFAERRSRAPDPTIVDPARLPADRASAVCGQCHAYAYPRDEDAFWRSGYVGTFRPGDDLEASRWVLSPALLSNPSGPKVDLPTADIFWSDGTVRVAGREYNAMTLSACFLRGAGERKIACTSCHSMHVSDPDGMLRRDRSVQAVCATCHAMPVGHSRHAPGSPGDACVACHMPRTSYALRTAIRSHRIDVPEAHGAPGRPNACNLCHLDRSLDWTARTLRAWRGAVESAPQGPELPEAARGLLSRDAAERVLWADAMGDPDALAASGSDWERPLLAYAEENDPYAVVRYVAARSRARVESRGGTTEDARVHVTPEDLAALARTRDDRDITVAE
jgi:predicted CXXCH cytochrome family protein